MRSTNSDMTTVFHKWPYGRLTEIQSNLRRKRLHRTNQGSNFLGGSFSNRDNVRVPIQFRREINPSILKDDFSSRTDPSIFTSIAPVLLDRSGEFLPQSTVSCRSDSSTEATSSSCFHRSEV